MKLVSQYGQIIDVDPKHAQMLMSQKVWQEYKESPIKKEESPKKVNTVKGKGSV